MARKCEGDLSRVNFSRVFSVLPQALRQLFVNSYQSLLWNDVAIDRCNNNNHNNDNDIKNVKNDNNNNVNDNIRSSDLSKCSVVELKSLLREKGLKVSGNKSELIARLQEQEKEDVLMLSSNSHTDNNDNNNEKKKNHFDGTDNSNSNSHSEKNDNKQVSGFRVTDTAVAGDIVLVDLKKQPLTAWHVAAQNISLNGHQIPLWSKDVGIKVPVPPVVVSVVINSNTPYNSNPNSPLYGITRGSSDYGGSSGDRNSDSRDGDRGRGRRSGDDRNDRNEVEEKEEIKEIKACYHLVTRYDVTCPLCVCVCVCVCVFACESLYVCMYVCMYDCLTPYPLLNLITHCLHSS